MKTNFNLDLALFFTSLSIILYSCGYFYIQSFVKHFYFTHEALGFDFQNYLIYGGLQGSQVIVLGILVPITLSLINKFISQNISASIIKIFNYIILFIILTIYKVIRSLFKLFYFPIKALSNFIYKFHKIANILEKITFLALVIFFFLFFILNILLKLIAMKLLNPLKDTHSVAKSEIQWESSTDTPNIDKGFKELITHYVGSCFIYALFFIGVFYLIDIEKNGIKDAEERFVNAQKIDVMIKDEKISQWYKNSNIKELMWF